MKRRLYILSLLVVLGGCAARQPGVVGGSRPIAKADLCAWQVDMGGEHAVIRTFSDADVAELQARLNVAIAAPIPRERLNSPTSTSVRILGADGHEGWVSIMVDSAASRVVLSGRYFEGQLKGGPSGSVTFAQDSREFSYWNGLLMEAAPAVALPRARDIEVAGECVIRRIYTFKSQTGNLPQTLSSLAEWDRQGALVGMFSEEPERWLYSIDSNGVFELGVQVETVSGGFAWMVFRSDGKYPMEWQCGSSITQMVGNWLFVANGDLVCSIPSTGSWLR